jgi:hypothetical protein
MERSRSVGRTWLRTNSLGSPTAFHSSKGASSFQEADRDLANRETLRQDAVCDCNTRCAPEVVKQSEKLQTTLDPLCYMSNGRRDYEQPMDALRSSSRTSSISTMCPRRRRTSLWSSLCFVAWTVLVQWHARVRAVACH